MLFQIKFLKKVIRKNKRKKCKIWKTQNLPQECEPWDGEADVVFKHLKKASRRSVCAAGDLEMTNEDLSLRSSI